MTGSKPLTIEEKMADALRAAPPHIAAATTVVDHDMVTVLREGSTTPLPVCPTSDHSQARNRCS
jgi:hypothetical protein